jgi:prepilin-type N-terminal cleavage/methylation domain-containing protein
MTPFELQHRGRGRRRRSAFTLVEVLATLVLIGIVVPFAVRGSTLALNTASNAKHQTEAATLGEAKLAELVSQGDWNTGTTQGDFGQDWPDYRWQVQAFQRTDTDVNVTEIVLSVTWTDRGQPRVLNVSTLAYLANGSSSSATGGLQ